MIEEKSEIAIAMWRSFASCGPKVLLLHVLQMSRYNRQDVHQIDEWSQLTECFCFRLEGKQPCQATAADPIDNLEESARYDLPCFTTPGVLEESCCSDGQTVAAFEPGLEPSDTSAHALDVFGNVFPFGCSCADKLT